MEKKNEPVYITKDGDILRDLPAAVAIVRKDVEETLQKTGISEYLSKSEEEKDRLREVMEGGSEKAKAIEKATDDSICGRTVKDKVVKKILIRILKVALAVLKETVRREKINMRSGKLS